MLLASPTTLVPHERGTASLQICVQKNNLGIVTSNLALLFRLLVRFLGITLKNKI